MPLWNESCESGSGGGGATPAEVETACGAAITTAALATASNLATLQTAVNNLPDGTDVQAACAAAITAAGLASQTSVDAIPDASQIQTACEAALAVKFPRIPDTAFGPYGPVFTGGVLYALAAATPDYYVAAYGFMLTSNKDCAFQIVSSGGATLGGLHSILAGVPFSPSAMIPVQALYRSNLDEGLSITCSDATATLSVTWWGGLIYAF